ncbi:MAG: sulfur carrier protein ThiS [Pseudomonadota bacterium]
MITISLNGEDRTVKPGTTLAALVADLSDDPRGIAIERNRAIVPKSRHGDTVLEHGDTLEIVQFVGGG